MSSQELGHLEAEGSVLLQEMGKISVDSVVKENVVVLLVLPSSLHLKQVLVTQIPHNSHFVLHLVLDVGFL